MVECIIVIVLFTAAVVWVIVGGLRYANKNKPSATSESTPPKEAAR